MAAMPQAEALLPSKRQITNSQEGFILAKHKGKKIMENYAFISMLRKYISSSVLLIMATVAALIVANSPWGDMYRRLWELPVSVSIGGFNIFSHGGVPMSFGTFINDFLMAIFFLSVGLEIKREVLCGELSSVKKALAPVIGACGGMLIPVIVFFLVCPPNPDMQRGMAIPMATDIAFSLGVLSIFSKRCPLGLIPRTSTSCSFHSPL